MVFIIFHLNMRSISKHFDQFIVMLKYYNLHLIDCIVLTECWLMNSLINFEIDGFCILLIQGRIICNQNSGIVVFISNKHKTIIVNEIFMDNCNFSNLSLCSDEISSHIIAIYREHKNIFINFKTQLSEIVNKIKTKKLSYRRY